MNEILNIIHKTIYQFFDVCEDDEEVPMSDKDKLLLEVNKAICDNLKTFNVPSTNAGDLISRQALLNAIFQKEYGHDYDENADILSLKYVDIIKGMPSVEPERKTGKWKKDKDGDDFFNCLECSCCGFAVSPFTAIDYNYCPNCGARMEVKNK